MKELGTGPISRSPGLCLAVDVPPANRRLDQDRLTASSLQLCFGFLSGSILPPSDREPSPRRRVIERLGWKATRSPPTSKPRRGLGAAHQGNNYKQAKTKSKHMRCCFLSRSDRTFFFFNGCLLNLSDCLSWGRAGSRTIQALRAAISPNYLESYPPLPLESGALFNPSLALLCWTDAIGVQLYCPTCSAIFWLELGLTLWLSFQPFLLLLLSGLSGGILDLICPFVWGCQWTPLRASGSACCIQLILFFSACSLIAFSFPIIS